MSNVIEADSAIVRIFRRDTVRVRRTKVALNVSRARSVLVSPGMSITFSIEGAPTELKVSIGIGSVILLRILLVWVYPDTVTSKARFETLNAYDAEQKPEEANEQCNVEQKRSRFLQTP